MTVAHTSDFCQSNKLIAQILAMCTEDRSIQVLLNELLGPGGVSFSMQPASRYAHPSEHLNFYELAARVQSYGETLCGYQTRWEKKAHTIINPRTRARRSWAGGATSSCSRARRPPCPRTRRSRARASPRSPRGQRGYASSAKMTRGTRSGRHDTIVASRGGTRRASMTGHKKRKEVSSAKLAASRRSLIASHDDGPLAEPGSPKIAPE
ncbi:hypothetical protein JL720_15666 [Aureococcus anophagefferens]|nr:hypothetical protein JL720_15666 [Aureococcus anophagefferens]